LSQDVVEAMSCYAAVVCFT